MTAAAAQGLSEHWETPGQILTYHPATTAQQYKDGPEAVGVWTLRLDPSQAIVRIALGGSRIPIVATIQLWQATGWTHLATYPVPAPVIPLAGPELNSHALKRACDHIAPLVAAITGTD